MYLLWVSILQTNWLWISRTASEDKFLKLSEMTPSSCRNRPGVFRWERIWTGLSGSHIVNTTTSVTFRDKGTVHAVQLGFCKMPATERLVKQVPNEVDKMAFLHTVWPSSIWAHLTHKKEKNVSSSVSGYFVWYVLWGGLHEIFDTFHSLEKNISYSLSELLTTPH